MVWRPRVALRGDAADGTGEVLLECEFFVDAGAKQYVLVHHFLDLLQQGLYDGTTATAASGVLQIGRGPAPAAPFGVESGGLGNVPRNASGMPAPKTMPTVAAPTRAITELVAAGLSTYIVFFDPRGDTAQFSICGGDSAVVPADVAQRAVMIGRLVKGFPLEPLQSLSLTAVTVLPAPTLRPVLRVSTSLGSFHIALLHQYAPVTCANIADLARSGFYDKQHIHRVVADFVVQLGCPNTSDLKGRQWGSGGPAPNTAFPPLDNTSTATMITRSASGKIPDEHVAKISNIKYNVAMANSGSPHSGGSQFFINMKHNSKLDWFNAATTSSHVVFGAVVDGYDVVDAIAAVKTNPSTDRPIDAIRIESVLLTTLDASAT